MVDLIIALIVFSQAVHWARIGFLKGGFTLTGFTIGIFLGSLVAPFVSKLIDGPLAKLFFALSVILLLAMAVGSLGRLLGERLATYTKKVRLGPLDSILGSSLGVVLTLVFVWFFAAILSGTQIRGLNQSLQGSVLLRTMDKNMPPAPAVVARITSFINTHGFPQVFTGLAPSPVEPVQVPSTEEVSRALEVAGRSTVRIESLGCGGIVYGSGFVAAEGAVVTNAHVVAGIDKPVIVDANGYHKATTVYFNKDLDLAILKTNNLAGKPLPIAEHTYPRGTSAAIVGYPGGGRLTAVPAGILREMLARGRDIYGEGISTRSVYELQASVETGNSGGPVVLPNGTVIGIVFAKSQTESGIGYSVISPSALPHIREAQKRVVPVDTGYCVSG